MFGLVNVCVSDFFELNCASETRGHPYKLYKQRSHSSVQASYFVIHVINVIMWISLLLLLSNAQLSKLILHRFYRVIVIDFDFDYFFVYSLDFTGLYGVAL